MSISPKRDGTSEASPEATGVRTEHDLRVLLRDALRRNQKFERALRESAAYAYGRRDLADLRKLRAVLSAAGFPDPNAKHKTTNDEPGSSAGS